MATGTGAAPICAATPKIPKQKLEKILSEAKIRFNNKEVPSKKAIKETCNMKMTESKDFLTREYCLKKNGKLIPFAIVKGEAASDSREYFFSPYLAKEIIGSLGGFAGQGCYYDANKMKFTDSLNAHIFVAGHIANLYTEAMTIQKDFSDKLAEFKEQQDKAQHVLYHCNPTEEQRNAILENVVDENYL